MAYEKIAEPEHIGEADMSDEVERLAKELSEQRAANRFYAERHSQMVDDVLAVKRLRAEVDSLTARAEKAEAALAKAVAALETIAEEHDAGRHDGLPEPCPAHDAVFMWAVARETVASLTEGNAGMETRMMTDAEREEIAGIERQKKAEFEAAAAKLFGAARAKHAPLTEGE